MARRTDISISVDAKDYFRVMGKIRTTEIPLAIAEALNSTAEAVTRQMEKNVKKRLTVRTKYTIKSMRRGKNPINVALGKNVDKMFSRAGTFSPYLWKQEGFEQKGKNGSPVPIPTLRARTSNKLTKSVRRAERLTLDASLIAGEYPNDKGKMGVRFIGRPKGGKLPFGLYARVKKNKSLEMMRNLEHNEIKIPDSNFHDDAVKKYGTPQFIRAMYIKEIERRIRGF